MLCILMNELAQKVGLNKELFYRPNAVKMYTEVFPLVQYLNGGTLVDCSFEGITGCDASFADEFVINLQKQSIKM